MTSAKAKSTCFRPQKPGNGLKSTSLLGTGMDAVLLKGEKSKEPARCRRYGIAVEVLASAESEIVRVGMCATP
jgi:hypothetical protein